MPLLLNFPDIFRDRIRTQHACFADAIERYGYQGSYACAFPVKANHSGDLVRSVLSAAEEDSLRCSLEVGSKPELLAALSEVCASGAPGCAQIICNGFKDRKYVELALLARKALGADVVLCVDRYEELELVIESSSSLGVEPALGVRAKLSTRHGGHWGATSGPGSKFGLGAREMVLLVRRLRDTGMLGSLRMLHFHLGSQVAEISVVKRAMREACALYAELVSLGAPLGYLDVGGGLALTYDGGGGLWTPDHTAQNYANDVVASVNDMCVQKKVDAPVIVTESGRYLASHHSVLVFEASCGQPSLPPGPEAEIRAAGGAMGYFLDTFEEVYEESAGASDPEEAYADAHQFRAEAQSAFSLGVMTLEELARAEELFDGIIERVSRRAPGVGRLESARTSGAVPCLANLSVFRSAIDAWAVKQTFPLVPISGLAEEPDAHARVYDLTCDSDGEFRSVATSGDAPSSVLPFRRDGSGCLTLGLFLVGAYQRSLGCDHNLLGGTWEATVAMREGGGWEVEGLVGAEGAEEVLRRAGYDAGRMRRGVEAAAKGGELQELFDEVLRDSGYLK